MMHCLVKDVECEYACELVIINQNTAKEEMYTMCFAHHDNMVCPYEEYEICITNKEDETNKTLDNSRQD